MGYRVDLMDRPADKVLTTTVDTPADRIGTAIGSATGQLLAMAADAGLEPCGPPEATYLGTFVPDSTVPAKVRIDMPVNGHTDGVPQFRHRPHCQVARTVYRGPYEGIGLAHRAVSDWAGAQGYRETGPHTEVYLVGPAEDRAPGAYLTEILVPLTR